jgi:hypothetical protein
MSITETLELTYQGRTIICDLPLGIYMDGEISGRIYDSIIPEYKEIDPHKLILLNSGAIETVRNDAMRQINSLTQQDTKEVRRAIQNTLNLTTKLLEK